MFKNFSWFIYGKKAKFLKAECIASLFFLALPQ